MKKLLSAMSALVLLVPAMPAQAGYSQGGGVKDKTCYKEVYREEYTPGTQERPGRVRRWTETKEVPCGGGRQSSTERNGGPRRDPRYRPRSHAHSNVDDNSCVEGSVIGGIGGGALGGALATKDNWIWSIPTGIIGGALVGCQVDGG